MQNRDGLWIAFCREAAIAGHSISVGLDSLRKANYAEVGLYSRAFFNLSIGIERTGKLIFFVDFMNRNAGQLPTEANLKKTFGHDLSKIYSHTLEIHNKLPKPRRRYPIPDNDIETKIIDFLSDFAKSTRYYNVDYISNSSAKKTFKDPIATWESAIGEMVYTKHYSKKRRQEDEKKAVIAQSSLSSFVHVNHTSEQGLHIDSVKDASLQAAKNRILQKFGTFYCVKVCRFFYMMLYDVNCLALTNGHDLPFLYEFFFPFLNDDDYLIQRKTFPPRR